MEGLENGRSRSAISLSHRTAIPHAPWRGADLSEVRVGKDACNVPRTFNARLVDVGYPGGLYPVQDGL